MKCTKCKMELEIDETYDYENDEYFIIEKVIGYCPKCEKEYRWELVYKYCEEENLVECT